MLFFFSSANPLMYRSKIAHVLPPWIRSNAIFHSLNGRNNLFTGVQKPSIIPKLSLGNNTHNRPTSSFHAYVMRRGPLTTSRCFSSSIKKPSHPRKSAKNIATFKSVSPPPQMYTLYAHSLCCVVCVSLE